MAHEEIDLFLDLFRLNPPCCPHRSTLHRRHLYSPRRTPPCLPFSVYQPSTPPPRPFSSDPSPPSPFSRPSLSQSHTHRSNPRSSRIASTLRAVLGTLRCFMLPFPLLCQSSLLCRRQTSYLARSSPSSALTTFSLLRLFPFVTLAVMQDEQERDGDGALIRFRVLIGLHDCFDCYYDGLVRMEHTKRETEGEGGEGEGERKEGKRRRRDGTLAQNGWSRFPDGETRILTSARLDDEKERARQGRSTGRERDKKEEERKAHGARCCGSTP